MITAPNGWELETETMGYPAPPTRVYRVPSRAGWLAPRVGRWRPPAPKRKLSPQDIREIRQRRAQGEHQKVLGAEYGVDVKTIRKVLSGLEWAEYSPKRKVA